MGEITKKEIIEHLDAVADIADRTTTGNLAHNMANITGTLLMGSKRLKESYVVNDIDENIDVFDIVAILEEHEDFNTLSNMEIVGFINRSDFYKVAEAIMKKIKKIDVSVVCPQCYGNQIIIGEDGYTCAYTDCQHKWTKKNGI